MVLASATQVKLGFTRERVRGTTPAGIGTPVDNVESEDTGGSANTAYFIRASGSWITDGFAVGQLVKATGFADADINANWRVASVTATNLEVYDPGDVIGDEIAAGGQTVEILLETMRTLNKPVDLEKDTLESEEVSSSRQKSDVRHGFNRVVGSPGFQFSRQDFDELMALAVGSTFGGTTLVTGIDLGITQNGDGTSTLDRASGDFAADGYRPGDIVVLTGFAGGQNNTTWRVLAIPTGLTLTLYDPNATASTEAAGAGRTCDLQGERLDVGTALETMYVERQFSDVSQIQKYNGVCVNEFGLSIQPSSIVGGTMALLGMSAAALTSSSESGEAIAAISGSSPYSAFDGTLFEGGSLIAVVTGIDFTLNNNRSLEAVVGSKFSPDVFEGDAVITGTLTAFFENQTLLNKFINETETSIWLRLDDPDGTNFCNLVFPRVKYTGGSMDPGQRGPVPLNMPFQALEHTTYNTSMSVQMSDR